MPCPRRRGLGPRSRSPCTGRDKKRTHTHSRSSEEAAKSETAYHQRESVDLRSRTTDVQDSFHSWGRLVRLRVALGDDRARPRRGLRIAWHKSTAPFTLSRLLDGSDCGLHCGSNRLLESSKLCLLAFRVRFALRSCSSMVLKQQGLQT